MSEHKCAQVNVSLWMCMDLCTYITPLPTPTPIRSTARFTAKQPCERVHMLCPVSALHPDNYCYIYHSKWEPWTGVITGWSRGKEGEGEMKKWGELRERERERLREEGRHTVEMEVTEVCCKLYCALWKSQCMRQATFSLNGFLFKIVMRLKGREARRERAAFSRLLHSVERAAMMTSVCLHVSPP